MNPWLLLLAAFAFSWLAYDAWKMATPAKDLPYAVTSKALGQDVSGVSLPEQNTRKVWNAHHGLGDLGQTVWLWGILAVASGLGALAGFLG